jgi:mercuric ion transport protein
VNLMSHPQNGRGALAAGGLAAILASACCLGPLVLVTIGVSGAWIANLSLLEPYRPIFIGVALVALFFAGRRIFRPVEACKPGEVCAIPQVRGEPDPVRRRAQGLSRRGHATDPGVVYAVRAQEARAALPGFNAL